MEGVNIKPLIILFLLTFLSMSFAKLQDIFNDHTSIERPFELRDPFQAPKFESRLQTQRKKRFEGVWDREQKLTGSVDINTIKVTGVLIGASRRALIKVGSTTYKMKEGEKLGQNGPDIKAILPGGIILVEQISNIYGETEYIETVIPISE